MMSIEGKGFFTWKIPVCENGDVEAIASQAKTAGLTHVLVKVANGIYSYNMDATTGIDYALLLTHALRARQIKVWGWHYCYGNNPNGEASKAIQRIQQLDLDGYVIDAENEYKQPGKREAAKKFMAQLRRALPEFPLALSSYRFPSYHPELPWREFLEKCDYNMPQVYWMKATNAGEQLTQCVRQFQAMTPRRPIIPTGAAFREHGWQSTPAEVLDFLKTAKSLNLSGANFWEWSDARSGNLPGIWEAVRDFSWTGIAPQKDICEKLFEAYSTRDPQKVGSLYHPTAVHISAARTIQGTAAICNWYTTFFAQVLPNARFTLTGFSGTGSSRHFNWTAVSSTGKVQNGDDTLGLAGDKIAYHFTSFQVTP
jgi:hypothetical protein